MHFTSFAVVACAALAAALPQATSTTCYDDADCMIFYGGGTCSKTGTFGSCVGNPAKGGLLGGFSGFSLPTGLPSAKREAEAEAEAEAAPAPAASTTCYDDADCVIFYGGGTCSKDASSTFGSCVGNPASGGLLGAFSGFSLPTGLPSAKREAEEA